MAYRKHFNYAFVVDTDSYAGSFERELTAYCTGEIGECSVGFGLAELFRNECPDQSFSDIIAQVPDDHGCIRPTSIWPTPGFWNDGMGNEWSDAEWGSEQAIATYRASCTEHFKEEGNIFTTVLPGRHPSYQSVAMFFHERPTDEQLTLLANRARAYLVLEKTPTFKAKPFKILGFRLIQEVTTWAELWTQKS